MSTSAPIFDPVKAQQKLTSLNKQLGFANSNEDPEINSDLMKKNIAEMYQYYNHLIFQQGGGMIQQSNIMTPGTFSSGPTPRLGDPDHFDRSSYPAYQRTNTNNSQELGVIGIRQPSSSLKTPGPRPLASAGKESTSSVEGDKSERSNSRSAHKSTENLLVSLNESCPPNAYASGANLSLERSMSVGNYAGRPSLLAGLKLAPSKSVMNMDDELLSVNTGPRARL